MIVVVVVLGLVVLVLGALGVVLIVTLRDSFSDPPLPSDGQLTERFTAHRQGFERLLEMFQSDRALQTGFDSAHPEKLAHLQALMQQLGVYNIELQSGMVMITMSTQGLVTSGSSKGYVYATKPPSPLVRDTGESAGSSVEGDRYRRIEGDWYVFFDWG